MMIATLPNNQNIKNSIPTNGKRTLIMMGQQAFEAPCYNERNEDEDDYVVAGLSIGLNHRGTNTTSSSLPSKTEMVDHPVNKLNLYDLLYTGMNSKSTNTNTMMKTSRLQNQPLSPKKSSNHHHHGMMTEGTTMMRRSASHDPQGVRNASWGVVSYKTAVPSRVSYPFGKNHSMATTTRRTLKKQSSSLDSATKLQQGVNEMLEMLQSTTFVGTIDPLCHGQYLKTEEEKVDDYDENSMTMTDNEEEKEKQAWNHGSPSKREQSRMMIPSIQPTSMVVLVPNNVPSPSSSSVSLVSFTPQQ